MALSAAPWPGCRQFLYIRKVSPMIRTLLGVVLSGTLLLGWCWYFSDYLPQHLQRLHVMGPPMQNGREIAEPADEQGKVQPSDVMKGPLKLVVFEKTGEPATVNYRLVGMALGGFLGVTLLASLLLAMA